MSSDAHTPVWPYQLAIVAATVIWGGSFTVMKGALEALTPGWLLAIRFALSAVISAVLFRRRIALCARKACLVAGVSCGLTAGVAYLVQNVGLVSTTPGKNAFLTATYCVMVPFINAALQRRAPALRNVAAAVTCLAGVGLIAVGDTAGGGLGDLALAPGDALTLLGAAFFAINIVQVSRLADAVDVVSVTIFELATCAVVCLAWALACEPAPLPSDFTPEFWAQMAYVVLLSTVFATMAQNAAQQRVPPAQAAILLSLESVFGALFSVLLYGERVTFALLAGFALIFVSVLTSVLAPSSVSQPHE